MTKKEDSKESATTDVLIKAIKKKYGNVINPMSESADDIKTVSTGSLGLDLALGRGGMALGRVYEVFGPNSSGKSTLGVHVIIQAQRRGLKCAYIDAEMAVDPKLFENYGVDPEKLTMIKAYGGEPNLDICERLVQTGEYSVIVVDSVSALIPLAEAQADMDKDSMALQARLMSKALRKITPQAAENNTLLIFVNQTRMKLNSYGCFHYDTLVNFTDGNSIPIGKVVDDKIVGNVWSLNEITGEIEEKAIIGWHDNGEVEDPFDFLHIQTSSIDGKGRFGFTCTPAHELYTVNGWKKANEFSVGDKLVSKYTQTVNGTYGDFLRGILVGDSHISVRDKNTGSLRLQDNENKEYLDWKLDKLSNFMDFNEVEIGRGFRYDGPYTYELSKVKKDLDNRDPMYLLNNFSDLGFAVWMMDDGNLDLNNGHRRYGLSIKRFKNDFEKLEEIKNKFNYLGFICNYCLKTGFFNFETSETDSIANIICKYVPKCMEYKLPDEYRGRYEEFSLDCVPVIVKDYVEIKEIRKASDRQMRKRRKFDISVEDNHNYMVGGKYNGVVVHNSPETTTGGEALNFWASGRISVRGPESKQRRLIDPITGDTYGHTTIFEIMKNKLGEPFKKCELNLLYGKGYDHIQELLSLSVSLNLIEKAGSWYKYNGENLAQGELSTLDKLHNNKALFDELYSNVIKMVGLEDEYKRHSNPGPLYFREIISSEAN